MLKISNLESGYGKVKIIDGVDVNIEKGEIVAVIGRNGVGKSTFIKTVIGILQVKNGNIEYENNGDISSWPAYKRARNGIGYVPQGHGIFPQLTVEENLKIGSLVNEKNKEENYERVYDYFPRIKERRRQIAGTMSGGEQAMLSIGRVLVNTPKIILLDEPSEGVQPNIVDQMGDIVLHIREDLGLTVLIVEQHLGLIQQVSDRGYVMDKGRIVTPLTKKEINNEEEVTKYLSV